MYDARLPFGASMSCLIFQTLPYAVVRMMQMRKFHVICYFDEFLCVEESLYQCQKCFDCLVELLEALGYVINQDKVEGPAQKITFLGISIDCVAHMISLPEDKLEETRRLLDSWKGRSKCTKRDLQSLIGHLNWCSRVVLGGRTFMRELIHLLSHAKEPYHFIRLNRPA
jgi:hypothetical protein